MANSPRKPLLVNLVWATVLILLLPILYVASYPIAVRVTGSAEMAVYAPVEWMIDDTVLRKPILRWAELCGAGPAVAWQAFIRTAGRPEMMEHLERQLLGPQED